MMVRTVIIIGATGGIGKVLYAQYKKQGYRLVGTCRTNSHNPSLTHVDITDAAEVESFAHQLHTLGPISVINCVGVNYNSVIEKS
jgi:short-subunit dehydrogenase